MLRKLVRQELREGRAETLQEAHENASKRLEAMRNLTRQAQSLDLGYGRDGNK